MRKTENQSNMNEFKTEKMHHKEKILIMLGFWKKQQVKNTC